MAQIFHPSTNTFSRLSIFGAVFLLAALAWLGAAVNRSSYVTQAGVARVQPVPFSHKHHVKGLGIDCRCMTCHTQIWADSPLLAPVRESFRSGKALVWTRVHDLPDFVYFDHSIHVQKGIGCVTCHGRVDEMPLTWQEHSLHMEWCLECHRAPERFVRPRAQVFKMDWEPPLYGAGLGQQLVREYHIATRTHCSVCHR
jgi:hypothetical protein